MRGMRGLLKLLRRRPRQKQALCALTPECSSKEIS